jgi:DNA-binding NtrC family response regulator
MEHPRVLVVEDKESVLRAIAAVLAAGYDVTTASDGATALSLLRAAPFDVVLADVRMPGITGFDVLRAARERAQPAAVVLMTAYANVPDAVAAMKLGAFDYVAKPLDADEIALVVARAVERARTGPCAEAREARAAPLDVSLGFHRAVEEARERASREYLVNLMRLFRGNVTQASIRASMTRESLHRVLRRYAVPTDALRETPDAATGSAPARAAAGPEDGARRLERPVRDAG